MPKELSDAEYGRIQRDLAPNVDEILSSIADNLSPDQVFDEDQLEAWVEAKGFVRKEDTTTKDK